MIGNSVTLFRLIGKYFLTTFILFYRIPCIVVYIILNYHLFIEMYCIVLNKFYCILFHTRFIFL